MGTTITRVLVCDQRLPGGLHVANTAGSGTARNTHCKPDRCCGTSESEIQRASGGRRFVLGETSRGTGSDVPPELWEKAACVMVVPVSRRPPSSSAVNTAKV